MFTSVLKHVKAIADLFCIRRFSTVATRFSKYGVARRNNGVNPTQRVEVSVKFARHQAPWGRVHFFQRLMVWNQAQSDPGNLPSSFNEEVIAAIGELGFDTVSGVRMADPLASRSSSSLVPAVTHFALSNNVYIQMLISRPTPSYRTGRNIPAPS